MPLTSIIIPTHNHARFLRGAIDSALAQTAEVEVIVVDDGSTDATSQVLFEYGMRIVVIELMAQVGVSAARNAGLDEARGEFVMFLDADDTIEPDKVARQVEQLEGRREAGWVLCDVEIVENGVSVLASKRYRYDDKHLNGWIQPHLRVANFIPIMSPLVRRSVLTGIRFSDERTPEDWHFWHAVAGAARCLYLPQVLARYLKRPGGRNTTTRPNPALRPGVIAPVRLNLGCGTPDTRSWHPIPGMVNLDRSLGWKFEDGLGDFMDGSVAGITVSHALMYVDPRRWDAVFEEFARVLRPGGVLRVTEDDTSNPASSRLGGWHGSEPAIALTDAAMVRRHMERVGFTVHDVTAETTVFEDGSLRQAQHGAVPDVFFVEGVRECCLLLSPHADDECLFCAFTIIRHRPHVVICFPSAGDYGDTATRTEESRKAVSILGGGPVEQWTSGLDLVAQMHALDERLRPTRVWAPSPKASHPDHVAVAACAAEVFGARLTAFQTYDAGGKVRAGQLVPFEPGWAFRKRQAMGCYTTQWAHPRARKFFDDDLAEYQA